LSIYLG